MEIGHLMSIDGNIVIGIVNEKLRLECDSIDELASRYEWNADELSQKMRDLGFYYDPITNQFK